MHLLLLLQETSVTVKCNLNLTLRMFPTFRCRIAPHQAKSPVIHNILHQPAFVKLKVLVNSRKQNLPSKIRQIPRSPVTAQFFQLMKSLDSQILQNHSNGSLRLSLTPPTRICLNEDRIHQNLIWSITGL